MAPKNQKFDGLLLYKTLNLIKTSSVIYFLYSQLTPIHLLECNDPILRGSHSLILLNMWLVRPISLSPTYGVKLSEAQCPWTR